VALGIYQVIVWYRKVYIGERLYHIVEVKVMIRFRCGCKGSSFKIMMDDNEIRQIECTKCKKIFGLKTDRVSVQ